MQQRKAAEKAAIAKARSKVLDCPLCGQHLKTVNVSHRVLYSWFP